MQNLAASLLQSTRNPRRASGTMRRFHVAAHVRCAASVLYRVLTLLIAVLPGILAFFVALLVFTLGGVVISWILRRCLAWVKFDLRLAQKRRRRLDASSSPTEIVGALRFLGVRAPRAHHRRLRFRHFLCHRNHSAHHALAISHARGGRGAAAGRRHSHRTLSGALGSRSAP